MAWDNGGRCMTEQVAGTALWLRSYRLCSRPGLRLVCFPHAGGGASFYGRWSRWLPPAVELLVVQYPGREDRLREAPVNDLHSLADLVAEALAPLLHRPLALFGHSLGAAVAYEVAHRLEEQASLDLDLRGLFVSGRAPPSWPRGDLRHCWEDDRLWRQLGELGGTSPELLRQPALRAIVLPYLRSDYRLDETYRPRTRARLSCPVVAYLGNADGEVDVDAVRGWSAVTRASFDVRVFAGGHFYLVERQAELIAELLGRLGVSPAIQPLP